MSLVENLLEVNLRERPNRENQESVGVLSVEPLRQVQVKVEMTEDAVRLAQEGNPDFIYDKIYSTGSVKEIPSFKCWKCPTGVDRMDRLEFHYLSHGAKKKYKCKFCDFSVDQMHAVLRHEESHRAQKQKKVSSPTEGSESLRKCLAMDSRYVPLSVNTDTDKEDEEVSGIDIGLESGEELSVDVESGEEVPMDIDEDILIGVDEDEEVHMTEAELEEFKRTNDLTLNDAQLQTPEIMLDRILHSNGRKDAEVITMRKNTTSEQHPSLSPTISLHGSESSNSIQSNERGGRMRKTSVHISEEDWERMRLGNPDYIYDKHYRQEGGALVAMDSYKCFNCPTSFKSIRELDAHARKHGGKKGLYRCRVCDFSQNQKEVFRKHAERHKAQGNISPRLLAPQDTSHLAKRGVDLGESEEVALLGNENDFEIEYGIGEEELSESTLLVTNQYPTNNVAVPDDKSASAQKRESCSLSDVKLPMVCLERVSLGNQNGIGEKSPDIYSLSSNIFQQTKKARPAHYLLKNMKIRNFMCFQEISFNLDSDAITFSGGEGKSSSIIALLLGLGYDLLLENYTPSVLCGWEISDLIRRGTEEAKIEITMCLKAKTQLYNYYGDSLKIQRTIRRGVPLYSSNFQVEGGATGTESALKTVSTPRLRWILQELQIQPLYSRLILLDRQNLKAMMNDSDTWYGYFHDAVIAKGQDLTANLENMEPLFKRLQGDLNWRRAKESFLMEQLELDHPVEKDLIWKEWREDDVDRLCILQQDILRLTQKYDTLSQLRTSQTQELRSVPDLLLNEMRTIYLEFLASQNSIGDILLDENEKKMRIWIREKSSMETELPINVWEVERVWSKAPQGKRQLATFGLYLALWKINELCPFFAVDSYSSAELEFKFPSKGLPILLRLVESKANQQFLLTFPDSDGNDLLRS